MHGIKHQKSKKLIFIKLYSPHKKENTHPYIHIKTTLNPQVKKIPSVSSFSLNPITEYNIVHKSKPIPILILGGVP